MDEWEIVVQVRMKGDTPDEAIAWLKAELALRLQPGEEGSPWQEYGKGTPAFVVGPVRRVRPVTGVPTGQKD